MNDFVDKLKTLVAEDAVGVVAATPGPAGGPAGTFQNDVSFVPGGLGTVAPVLSQLRKKKKAWRVRRVKKSATESVLELGDVRIQVQDADLPELQEAVFGLGRREDFRSTMLVEIDEAVSLNETEGLPETVNEAQPDLAGALEKVREQLEQLLKTEPLRASYFGVQAFQKVFAGKYRPVTLSRSLLRVTDENTLVSDLNELVDSLRSYYRDDRGGIEMVLEALRERQPLNLYPSFAGYDHLFAFQVEAPTPSGMVLFRWSVDFTYRVQQWLGLAGASALLGDRLDVQVEGNRVFPAAGQSSFTLELFESLAKMAPAVEEPVAEAATVSEADTAIVFRVRVPYSGKWYTRQVEATGLDKMGWAKSRAIVSVLTREGRVAPSGGRFGLELFKVSQKTKIRVMDPLEVDKTSEDFIPLRTYKEKH